MILGFASVEMVIEGHLSIDQVWDRYTQGTLGVYTRQVLRDALAKAPKASPLYEYMLRRIAHRY